MLGVAGVTVMDMSDGTVSVVDPDFPPEAAVIVAVPVATAVASPVLFIVAMAVDDELHVTDAVRFCVELSV